MFQVELIWQKQSKITPVYKKEFLCAVKFWYKLLNPTEIFQIKRTLYFLYVAHSTEKRNCQISCKADVKIWSFKAIVTCFPVYFLCCIQKPFGCTTPSYRSNVQNKYKNLRCASEVAPVNADHYFESAGEVPRDTNSLFKWHCYFF